MNKTIWAVSALLTVLVSCGGLSAFENKEEYPDIFPDYVGVTVPEGIAELRFQMADGREFKATTTREGDVQWVSVKAWKKGDRTGTAYKPFPVYVSRDAIDPYIAYRLIEPGYESWHDISISQRELASFKETEIVNNRANNLGCINCHTFYGGDPQKMFFHARGAGGGTVFANGDEEKLINLAGIGPNKQGTYPAWHPGGRYVAFSSNTTRQVFTLADDQPIEVYDIASDIILMDLETETVYPCPALTGEEVMETFPTWSEDGSTLYYCAAEKPEDVVSMRGSIHYRLMSIGFENGAFIGEPQVVWADSTGSASFPRISDGKLLFTRTGFGTFPIWHREADLYMLDLSTGEASAVEELNSPEAESYHSWSSNGKWVVYGSRRLDGRYTRLFLAHYRGGGHFDKPFLLPQEKPEQNQLRLKSYNLPEFLTAPSPNRQKETAKLFAK